MEHENHESYVAYLTINTIVGEMEFPSSELFYYQQQQFTFPIDTSMNVEIVTNKKALATVRNKKKELKAEIEAENIRLANPIMRQIPMS